MTTDEHTEATDGVYPFFLSLSCLSSSQQGLITWFSAMGGLGLGGPGLHHLGWLAGSGRRMCLDSLVWWCCGVVMKGGGRSVVDGGEWVRGDRVLDLSSNTISHASCVLLSCCRAVLLLGRDVVRIRVSEDAISGVRCEMCEVVGGCRWALPVRDREGAEALGCSCR